MNDVWDELQWRGLVAHSTDEAALQEALQTGPLTYYVGFDPTAASLHVGHLVQVLTAKRLQQAGHRPLILVGGATGLVGDPRPSAERTMNDPSVVAGWVTGLQGQIAPFLDFDGPAAATMVNNLDWTQSMSTIEFLRDVGKHFSVNRMLDREAVSKRLATTGISFTEFSYVLLQSNDYLQLHRRHGCTLQLGGSDQWGNITAGCELVRRVDQRTVHALATPLLTKADGTKFGKTESGAVWLDPELTSPYAFHQFWLNAEDAKVVDYLKAFSFRPREEIEELGRQAVENPRARAAQRALAHEVTALVHGEEAAVAVEAAAAALFGGSDLEAIDERILRGALAELPTAAPADRDVRLAQLFADTGLAPSLSGARRTIGEGGAYVNNIKLTDPEATLRDVQLLHGRYAVLRRGKKSLASVAVPLPQ
ncbi:tyrosine--tRNA ligase [Kineococcus radiotolerans]|uniref:Tyrosine--tRNA ligase n=1 Tax=Kineococcus radiotolerans (strain ATCC BAA-149 / DSM 14245 / SRS30216) TaxID=266940 RepID=SYY_KINRD|nr:tyrosine--tRNA ligase [Kineococcus radiotolerans]A6WCS8.1 RecName: Full=Tyrosine--tRNA ligase; AltName: Full=Tyrosyl-tRNA synthetase; Short=TyrRS [Kineococcus radiotolerans SRS30216 = ATCC BAA-149]ABS04617.1 tyrosyl-tRNA synthetase [Kineococcus radiotolerans SRS30216 = ATCC BAA-149]